MCDQGGGGCVCVLLGFVCLYMCLNSQLAEWIKKTKQKNFKDMIIWCLLRFITKNIFKKCHPWGGKEI